MTMKFFITIITCLFFSLLTAAQQKDTSIKTETKPVVVTDTVKIKTPHSPRKATIRSAMIPGWGQAYNKKYWKIPIVYAALGTCAGFFIYNRKEYTDARDAYRYKADTDLSNDVLIKPKFAPVDAEAVRQYRNGVRQNADYSVLAFLICWGLNVVDATVDGHFKDFEVNENLSIQINPSFAPQTKQTQIGLVMHFGKR